MTYWIDFVIRIRKEENVYIFEQVAFPFQEERVSQPALFSFPSPLTDSDVKKLTPELLRESDEPPLAEDRRPKTTQMTKLGKKLWEMIPEGLRNNLLNVIRKVQETDKRLRLRLHIIPPELYSLPWESLCVTEWESTHRTPSDSPFLSSSQFVSIVRIGSSAIYDKKLALMEHPRVLLVGAFCGDDGRHIPPLHPQDVRDHLEDVKNNFIAAQAQAYVYKLEDPTPEEFMEKLKEGEGWHIVHFYGHGYDDGGDHLNHCGIILNGGYITAADLARVTSEKVTRLFILCSCETACGFGYGLNDAGIPAVLVMRYALSREAARRYFKEFYSDISKYKSIDAAFHNTRKVLYDLNSKSIAEWHTPVLFLSSRDGKFFATAEEIELGNYLRYMSKHYSYTGMSLGKSYVMDAFIPVSLGKEMEKPENDKLEDQTTDVFNDLMADDFQVWRDTVEKRGYRKLESLEIQDVLEKEKRIIIKGDPGSGKTTLLQFMAFEESKKSLGEIDIQNSSIPVFLPLNRWAEHKGDFVDCLRSYYKDVGLEPNLFNKIEALIKTGGILILLDGLDEVTTNRIDFIEKLRKFCDGMARNCKVVMTTRYAGYGGEFVDWEHYEMMPFKDIEKKDFVGKYFGKDSEQGRAFLNVVKMNAQMSALSSNPLFIKLMCYVYEKNRLMLPTRRVEMYNKITDILLEEDFKRRGGSLVEMDMIIEEYKAIIEKIALDSFIEGKEAFSFDEFKKSFSREERILISKTPYESGLLQKLNDGRYTFLHLTFQEYFSACALKKHLTDYIKKIEESLWDWERWEEVLLLLSALLKDRIIDLTEMLLKHDDNRPLRETFSTPLKDKDPLRQMFFLAINCFEEAGAESENFKKQYENLKQDFFDKNNLLYSLFSVSMERFRNSFSQRFVELITRAVKNPDRNVRNAAARVLGAINPYRLDENGVDKLANLLISASQDTDKHIRETAMANIYNNANNERMRHVISNKMTEMLIRSLDDESRVVRRYSVLLILNSETPQVIKLLPKVLDNDDDITREFAIIGLGKIIGKENPDSALELLLKSLKCGQERTVEAAVVSLSEEWCLRKINKDKLIKNQFIEALEALLSSECPSICCSGAELLCMLDAYKAKAILEKCMKDDFWKTLYTVILIGLTKKKKYNISIFRKSIMNNIINNLTAGSDEKSFIINALTHENHILRWAAVNALIGFRSGDAIRKLLELLKDNNIDVCGASLNIISRIYSKKNAEPLTENLTEKTRHIPNFMGPVLPHIIETSFGLETGISDFFSMEKSMGTPSSVTENFVIDRLVEAFADEKCQIHAKIPIVLGAIGSEKAIEPLIKMLDDTEAQVRRATANALGAIGSEKAIEPLIKTLNDKDSELRRASVKALGAIDDVRQLELPMDDN
ncbi:MAG: HEAT repeat domain-containing protein [Candidatus Xenobiia bacterium LiM19]